MLVAHGIKIYQSLIVSLERVKTASMDYVVESMWYKKGKLIILR